jgi:hypothetical protein
VFERLIAIDARVVSTVQSSSPGKSSACNTGTRGGTVGTTIASLENGS